MIAYLGRFGNEEEWNKLLKYGGVKCTWGKNWSGA